jgi:hypothetical protein
MDTTHSTEPYKIVPWKDRFVIMSNDGVILDDAQGYGYTTREKASKAAWWKFKGGKKKADSNKAAFRKWLKEDVKRKEALKHYQDLLEWNFKDIALGTTTDEELWCAVEEKCGVAVPREFWGLAADHWEK